VYTCDLGFTGSLTFTCGTSGFATADICAAITGTITTTIISESQLRAGGQTIVVTLTNDRFNAFTATNTEAIFDALGTGVSTPGWDVVKSSVGFPGSFALSTVSTTDDTLTLTLPAVSTVTLGADEVLTTNALTVPSANVIGSSSLVDVSGNVVTLEDEGHDYDECMVDNNSVHAGMSAWVVKNGIVADIGRV
jgi:hypothetical protein